MPVSHARKCIFVHIPKTAGSSVTESLLGLETRGAKVDRSRRHELFGVIPFWWRVRYRIPQEHRTWQHLPARELQRITPAEQWQSYFKFSFVRNPWDRMVSLYEYLRSFDLIAEPFEIWLHAPHGGWIYSPSILVANQVDFLEDEGNQIAVDFVGRFESLRQDFAELCTRLGIAAALPALRASAQRNPEYRTYYTQGSRDLVAKRFEKDIDVFQYQF